MLISLNWIKEFVDLPSKDADDLANTFTMTTAEVEDVKHNFTHLKDICVAEITAIEKHPEADKLNLVTFDFGQNESKRVVCGAPNVKLGLKVPYACLGVSLPNGLTLEPKKIRGVLSEGMLCSEVELGLGDKSSGLMELKEDAKNGMNMLDYLKLKADTILDVDNKSLTHRPDLWGHLGLAREFAAAYDRPLKNPYDLKWQEELEKKFTQEVSPIKPKVDKDSSCLSYWGLSIDNVKVGKSPTWLVNRLESVGLRSINNIVDISNYVMMELGIPLHIFDRDKIKDQKIHIKKLNEKQNFETLDGIQRELIAGDTVICDAEKVLVLAGIMGGENSGVDENTKNIFIEVANWKAHEVRLTSTRLGLRTDSSARYEKSLDSLQCYRTLLRTLDLVLELSSQAKVVGKPEYDGIDLKSIKPLSLKTSYQKIRKVLGTDTSDERIKKIFESLDFKLEVKSQTIDEFVVTLPSYRTTKDIEYEADLIEEVGRIIGYDNIEAISPLMEINPQKLSPHKSLFRKIQDFLVLNARSLEVMTYPLIGEKLLEKSLWPSKNEELILVNALSKDADRMRPSLIPHALQTCALNAKNFNAFSFFEIGRSYHPCDKNFSREKDQLLLAYYDKKESCFLKLLNQIEDLLNYLNIPFQFASDTGKFKNELIDENWPGLHPHEKQHLKIMGKFQGLVMSLHPLVMKNFKIKGHFSFLVLDLSLVMQKNIKAKNSYKAISKFPSASFDCTVLVDKDRPLVEALEVVKQLKIKELVSVLVVDVFDLNDKQIALTLQSTFMDEHKTLEPSFIKECEDKIVSVLADKGFPLKA